jgi:hypothetical protein
MGIRQLKRFNDANAFLLKVFRAFASLCLFSSFASGILGLTKMQLEMTGGTSFASQKA